MVKRGEFLGSEKVVHVPGIPIGSTTLSKLDEEKIRTGIQLNVDVILVSGVRNSMFLNHVRKFVSKSSTKCLRPANKLSAFVLLHLVVRGPIFPLCSSIWFFFFFFLKTQSEAET